MKRERDEDVDYDEAVQSIVEARQEGLQVLAASLCPYLPTEPEYASWHEGRMQGLARALSTKRAA